jgi:hypothetical protein
VTEQDRPTVICVTPVKNEAWLLDRFLTCASQWADHIIVADQCSTDGSREIVARFPKAMLIENDAPAFNEPERQKLLVDAARKLPANSRRLVIALDADEIITANWQDSPEWTAVLNAAPGTVIHFQWVNILPDMHRSWLPGVDIPLGFMDDGSDHTGRKIHSTRIPTPADAPSLALREIKLLHYPYTDWERMESKQRWYQCFELLQNRQHRPIRIYRMYHAMYGIPEGSIMPLQAEWTEGYSRLGIDMAEVRRDPDYWWDGEVLAMLERHGPEPFRKLDIWDIDWEQLRLRRGGASPTRPLRDPRSALEKRVHRWLRKTQPRALSGRVRFCQRALRLLGW